jgi:8-oxo-dGTP diphosphatase
MNRLAIYHRVQSAGLVPENTIDADAKLVACAVAVVVTHQQKVLFGKRVSGTTEYEWQLPGGWIEIGETPQLAARREVVEETGIQVADLQFVGITNNIFSAQNHSISMYFEAECVDAGSLQVGEASKCISWVWKYWEEVSDNLFLPLQLFKQSDYRPFLDDERRTKALF